MSKGRVGMEQRGTGKKQEWNKGETGGTERAEKAERAERTERDKGGVRPGMRGGGLPPSFPVLCKWPSSSCCTRIAPGLHREKIYAMVKKKDRECTECTEII